MIPQVVPAADLFTLRCVAAKGEYVAAASGDQLMALQAMYSGGFGWQPEGSGGASGAGGAETLPGEAAWMRERGAGGVMLRPRLFVRNVDPENRGSQTAPAMTHCVSCGTSSAWMMEAVSDGRQYCDKKCQETKHRGEQLARDKA